MNKRRLKKKLKDAKNNAKYYRQQIYGSDKLHGGAKEITTIITIDGGFLLADKNGGSLKAPITFFKTPDELCEAIKKDLTVKAMTR